MKTLPALLTTHYAQGSTTLAHLLYIVREDAEVFAFTSADRDIVLDGVTYTAAQGLDASNIVSAAGLAVENLELTTLHDGSLFTSADVLSGIWRNAAFSIYEVNWATPTDGVNPVLTGTFGEVKIARNTVVVELRGLQQALQQPVGIVTSPLCRARFADSACRLNASSNTRLGFVSVAGQQTFTASADNPFGIAEFETDDLFGNGVVTFVTGACAGLSQVIKTHTADSVITLTLPMLLPVQVNDEISVLRGCRKRLNEDCNIKHFNVLNFQGEPHVPGTDAMTKPP